MKIPLIAAAATALALTAPLSQAMVINSAYTSLGGNSWQVDFTLVNDGATPSFAGFTVDLPDATDLMVVASASGWDSIVFPAQPHIPADAAFDGLADNPATIWNAGPSIGGFKASFTYSGSALPGATAFTLYNESYATVFAGVTTVTAVPEPATALMAVLGLAFVGLRMPRASARRRSASEEVAA